jgi:multidrug efflux pump subunit AcrB
MKTEFGFAGKLAAAFINSKLTPLVIIASLLLGMFAVLKTPREEEPQIIVPMADVIVQMAGATSKDVEQRVTVPMEKLIWEVPGVEYVYSTSSSGTSLVVVRFLVGQDQEKAFVRLREKLQSHFDAIPPGATQPIIKPHSIDDVPVLALTLHSNSVDSATLRQIAARVEQNLKSVPDVSETTLIGGQRKQLNIVLDEGKLAAYGLTSDDVNQAMGVSNTRTKAGQFSSGDSAVAVDVGALLRTPEQVAQIQVASPNGHAIRVEDVATITSGPSDPENYAYFGTGAASKHSNIGLETAVTIAVSKRQGVNAVDLVTRVLAKLETLKGTIIPDNVTVSKTRDYGASSSEKSNELLFHMGIAVVSVTILIGIALGRKESLVVLVAIPVTLALTLLVFYLYGFTLNRITLFALIFSIGILVDDAIVVVENIVRHLRMPGAQERGLFATAIHAVDEVGNPTILATFAVIAAILPMAFVGGLMGPYMRPIPVGASAAMIFSLLIAFMVTPWAAVRILKDGTGKHHEETTDKEDFLTTVYRKIMTPLLRKRGVRAGFFGLVAILLLGSMALVGIKAVTVKMLPFDNKSEFQIVVDMPTGTTLERTLVATRALAEFAAKHEDVLDFQIYVGTSSPYNFNGLVRHYFMRSGPNQADIQINLTEKGERKLQSHDIAKSLRPGLAKIANQFGARIKLAEVPPGPPVLQTLVAEVYGPDQATRVAVAQKVKDVFKSTEGVADVDWYVDDDQQTVQYVVDQEKAAQSGVSVSQINGAIATGLGGSRAGLLHDSESREDIPIVLRLPVEGRSGLDALAQIKVRSATGSLVPASELVQVQETPTDKSIYHKNLLPVVYITGDVTGRQESPVYAILQMNKAIDKLQLPGGVKLNVLTTHLPEDTNKPAMKWDGEWHITYEVFRDLGVAFGAVLILIYILVVAWFQDFKTPLVIMAPIPLTLVGILPAHALMGAFFTATSMIGFIAGAGIIVRNSIILVDFIELRRKEGSSLEDAVIDAGAIRFRPMLLTAAAVIVGSFVILFDPIFQGLAIALMAGEIASTLLSRLAVPVLYFLSQRGSEISA